LGRKKIASYLNENGHTRRGNIWRHQEVHVILRNRVYIGEYETFKRDTNKKRDRPKEEWVITQVPAIIGREEFDLAQEGMTSRNLGNWEARSETSPSI